MATQPIIEDCGLCECPLTTELAVQKEKISALDKAVSVIGAAVQRIQWATIVALGSLSLALLSVVFTQLGKK